MNDQRTLQELMNAQSHDIFRMHSCIDGRPIIRCRACGLDEELKSTRYYYCVGNPQLPLPLEWN